MRYAFATPSTIARLRMGAGFSRKGRSASIAP